MMIDYHLHTVLCKHATGRPEDYARRAVEIGLAEIGFSCHSPMPPGYDPSNRMVLDQLPEYVEMVLRCRKDFPRLPVKLGIETDLHPGTEEYARDVLRRHAFDYVIGSVHYLGSWGFDNPDQVRRFGDRDLYDIYAEYYDRVATLARSGFCDIMGHLDLIKKFGHRPERDYAPLETRALEAVAAAGLAIDVNTSGLRRPAREIYPSLRILQAARRMGIGITFGSDAHEPGLVGASFGQAAALARAAGYTGFRRYAGRRWEDVPLSPAGV